METKRPALIVMICLVLMVAGCAVASAAPSNNAVSQEIVKTQPPAVTQYPRRANFNGERQSRDARNVADWVVDSGDNGILPFMIVDKINAKAFIFSADGNLRAATPILVGLTKGDHSVPGTGAKKLSAIRREERTTPAGRFVALPGRNLKGKDILWVDYENALSVHRAEKSRQKRLKTPTLSDKRITLGCINVPERFYDDILSPIFAGTQAIVYILPEVRSKQEIFTSYYDVDSPADMRPVSADKKTSQTPRL